MCICVCVYIYVRPFMTMPTTNSYNKLPGVCSCSSGTPSESRHLFGEVIIPWNHLESHSKVVHKVAHNVKPQIRHMCHDKSYGVWLSHLCLGVLVQWVCEPL